MLYYHYISLPTQNISNIPKTTLYAWGLNSYGQLGDGTTINRSTPVSLNAQFSPTSSTGNNHTAIVYSDGSLYMTGFNQYGQLGDGTTINKSTPVKIGSSSWTSVTAQADSTVGLTIAGTLWSWGRNSFGELGVADVENRSSPVQITTFIDSASYASWAAVSVGQVHSLAIRKSDYSLWGWGLATSGQIGDGTVGTVSYRSKPVLISKSRSWSVVSAGTNFSAAIDTTGALYMWGLGTSGQLGDNTGTNRYAPTKIGNSSWSTVSTGQIHTIAIDSTGGLYAWGFNQGALGDNTATIRSSPVKIGSSSWSKISAANSYSAAIDTVGRLFTWGLNANGQLGDGTTITKSSPVQIGTSSWSAVDVGNSQAFAVTNLGTLYAWGVNSGSYLGGLGDGTSVDRSSPVVVNTVASYSSWRIVSASEAPGGNFTLAIRDQDSSLWAWGRNAEGQLGDGTTVIKSAPVKIGSSSWSTVNAGNSGAFGVTSDGKLYAWGLNAAYQLGDGTTVSKSSPVQVGALNTFSTFASQFNGAGGCYLSTPNTVANQPGSGDFTIEAWLNTTYSSNSQTASLISQYNTGALGEWNLGFQQNLLRAIVGQSALNDISVPICDGTWHHIAWVRNGSGTNNNTLYVDGRAVLQFTNTTTLNGNAQPLYIGEAVSAGGSRFTGSVSNVRFVKGTAVYTSDFNTLSVPLTAIANTALLTCQSDTFIDNSTNAFTITNNGGVVSSLNTIVYPLRSSNSWTAVATGDSHTTAIATDGSLWTWGSNTFGQVGNFINQPTYTVPTKLPNSATPHSWAQISEGVSHTLAISNTGLLYGWGGNASGQLGDGTVVTRSSPVLISAKSWSKVSAGYSHSVAIDSLGTLYAWGDGAFGKLGDGTTVSKSLPVKIGNSSWTSITASSTHTAAIDTTGALYIWGYNASYQLGDGTTVNKSSPIQVAAYNTNTFNTNSVSFNGTNQLLNLTTNTGLTIGTNNFTIEAWVYWNNVTTENEIIDFRPLGAQGLYPMIYVTSGNIYYWVNSAIQITGAAAVTTGQWYHIAVSRSGSNTKLFVNGTQVGSTYTDTNNYIVGANRPAIAYNGNTGSFYLNGYISNVRVVNGTSLYTANFTPPTSTLTAIANTALLTCNSGTIVDNSVNNNTILNTGAATVTSNTISALLPYYSSWSAVSAGQLFTTGITSDGKLWTWGNNAQGQIGYLTGLANYSTPTQIANSGSTYSWVQLATGDNGAISAGITTTGALYTWGQNTVGSLGDGTTVSKSTPIKIGNSSWTSVTVGNSDMAAIDSTGALYTWGANQYGQLGDGTTVNKSSPVKIGTNSWSVISLGNYWANGVTSTGALFGWGYNPYGNATGDNTLTNRSSPVAISIPTGTLGFNSVLFNGTNQYLTTNTGYINSSYTCTGDFTVEGWYYPTNVTGNHSLFTLGSEATGRYTWFLVGNTVTSNIYGSGSTTYTSTISINTWNHIAVVRSGSTVKVYTNGVLDATTDTQAGTIGNGTLRIGADGSGSTTFAGNISNFRFVKGTAVYSGSSFTVPTQPISAIANTILMTCQSSPITDITPVNSPTISTSVIPFTIPTTWTDVDVGAYYSVAESSNGQIYSWGDNGFGQIGDGTAVNRSTPVKAGAAAITYTEPVYWSKTAAGGGPGTFQDTFGIRSNGSLWAWGSNNGGQLGDNTIVAKSSPIQIGTSSWSQIGAGFSHAVAIDSTGALYAWGSNVTYGQLGDNTTVAKSSPVKIGSSSWSLLSVGYLHNAAIDTTGKLYTWGSGVNGQIGDSTATSKSNPTLIGASSWSVASAGTSNTAAIDINGRLFTWGYGNLANLGDGTTVTKSSPVQVGSSSWAKVSVGGSNTLAITIDGSLYVWGSGSNGQLGDGTTVQKSLPTKIGSSSWSFVSAGQSHCAAIDSVGRLFTWGNDANGQLGDGTTINKSSPVQIGTSSWSAVYAGQTHTSAIDVNGNLFVWGLGTSGAIGDGTTISKSSPVVLAAFSSTLTQTLNSYTSWSKISAGAYHATAIDYTGSLWTWGYNNVGQLSDGTTINKSRAVQLVASTPAVWKQISQNEFFTLAIRNQDSSLWAWGLNNAGQLGDGTIVSKSSPVKIGTSSWSAVAAGNTHSVAIDITGALYAWGLGTSGQLGDNTAVSKSSPVKIGSSSWTKVTAGNLFTAAIDSTGKAYGWGVNNGSQLGDGTTVIRSSPVAVATPGNWKKVSISQHALAIDSTSALWAWGLGTTGQLGDNTVATKYSPVKIGTSSWATIAACRSASAGITVDGRLFTWGSNDSSQLGDSGSTFNHKSSPVQIGTDKSWTALGATDLQCAGFSAIDTSGRLYFWGSSLGQGGSPVQMGAGNSFVMSSQGTAHLLAIDTVGRLWGLLGNTYGNLGDGTTVARYTAASPVQIGNSSWSFVRAGYSSSSAIDINGRLFTWGFNSSYELGDGTTINRSSPVQIGIDRNWIFAKTALASCAIDSTNTLWHWGYNGYKLDGTSNTNISPTITNLPNLSGLSPNSIEITQQNIIAYNSSGNLYAWGDNSVGQLADSTQTNKSSPVFVKTTTLAPSTQSWTSISAGNASILGINNLGNLYGWGGNLGGIAPTQIPNTPPVVSLNKISVGSGSGGQNGYAVDTNQNLYSLNLYYNTFGGSKDGFAPKVSVVSVGNSHQMVIDTLGRLWVWGANAQGQLGDGGTTAVTYPKRLTGVGASSWSKISAGSSCTMGITVSGELYGWGYNLQGQLGIGNSSNQTTPQKVGTSSWAMVATGKSANATLGIDAVGRLFAWGSGAIGQNGFNSVNYSSPVQIGPAGSSWTMVSISQSHCAAIDTLGRIWTWGASYSGGLGNGQTFTVTPTQIYGTNSYTLVSAGWDYTMAIDTTGALYAWGQNGDGRLGDGTITSRSSPTKIGTSSWSAIDAGYTQPVAITTENIAYSTGYNAPFSLNTFTQLNVYDTSTPTYSSWSFVNAGGSTQSAIDTTGSLYMWGYQKTVSGSYTFIPGIYGQQYLSYPTAIVSTKSWSSISTGSQHVAAITSTGSLFTWGYNGYGNLGDYTTVDKSSPVQIGTSSWTSVSVNAPQNSLYHYTTGILSDGTLYTWGSNVYGQLADNSTVNKSSPVLINSLTDNLTGSAVPSWTSVSAGREHAVAIATTGALWAWGSNTYGQLGDNTTVSKSTAVRIGTSSWTIVSTGNDNTKVINTTGNLYAWGYNNNGQLGDRSVTSRSSPVLVTAYNEALNVYSSWTAVSAGTNYTTAIDTTGALWAWGYNNFGNLGNNSTTNNISPVKIGSSSWTKVAAGDLHTMGIDINSRLYGWGYNGLGNLGDNTVTTRSSPVQIGTSSWTTVAVSNGSSFTTAINLTGNLFAWGFNSSYQLGDGTTITRSSPVAVSTVYNEATYVYSSWSAVAAGGTHTAAITSARALFTWGLNNVGQLGDGTTINKFSLVQIGTNSWSSVALGNSYTTAINTIGRLFTWGQNTSGQLGDGTTISKSSPVQLGTSSWTVVSAGLDSTFALNTLGCLYSWGNGATNQLGDGSATRSSPVQVGSLSWTTVSAGSTHAAAINTTGNVYTWGLNTSGQLGDGTTTNRSAGLINSVPYSYNTTSWSYVGLSNAIDSTGALYAWGVNASGQLGDGTTISRSVPIKIGSSSWSVVNGNPFSNNNNLGLDINGQLFTWGLASSYQLGDVTTTSKSSPVQIGLDTVVADTSFNLISSGTGNFFYSRGISGSLYGWGNNTNSQLGSGTNPLVNNPQKTLVTTRFYNPSATWSKISLGASHTMAIDTTGGLWVWGLNTSGQLGDNTIISKSSPVKLGTSSWTFVKASHFISIAITTQGALYAWGFDDRGNPARASAGASTSSPVLCYAGSSFSFVGTNSANNAGGTAYCSTFLLDKNGVATFTGYSVTGENGNNSSGGFGSTTNQPLTGSSWTIVDVGGGRTGATPGGYVVGITTAGALYAWGDALSGALGDGTVTTKTSWVNKIGNSSWAFVQASSNRTTVGIDIQGRLFMWGDNTWGSLGDGTTINKSSPVQVGNSSWVSVSASFGQILAVDSSGRLFAWGLNSSGQMGDGTTINKSSPVQISVGKSNWISVATGQGHSSAIDSTNTLYTWGLDSNGQLGNLR